MKKQKQRVFFPQLHWGTDNFKSHERICIKLLFYWGNVVCTCPWNRYVKFTFNLIQIFEIFDQCQFLVYLDSFFFFCCCLHVYAYTISHAYHEIFINVHVSILSMKINVFRFFLLFVHNLHN